MNDRHLRALDRAIRDALDAERIRLPERLLARVIARVAELLAGTAH